MPLAAAEVSAQREALSKALAESRLDDCRALLKTLKAGVVPTEELIRATKIGQAVGKLRNHSDKALSQAAKDLVGGWKVEIEKQRAAGGSSAGGASASASGTGTPKVKEKKSTPATSNGASPATPGTPSASAPAAASSSAAPSSSKAASGASKPSSSAKVGGTSKSSLDFEALKDKTRNACLKVLYNALEVGAECDASDIYSAALGVESAVFDDIGKGSVTADYRNKLRSLTLNLKDASNPALRSRVLSGELTPSVLVQMGPEDLASDARREEREKLQMQNLFGSKAAEDQQAETDAFECGRCKQRKTRYYQKQTRSADEPMTTFVTCTNCNNKWKFC